MKPLSAFSHISRSGTSKAVLIPRTVGKNVDLTKKGTPPPLGKSEKGVPYARLNSAQADLFWKSGGGGDNAIPVGFFMVYRLNQPRTCACELVCS